ncbi:hypothetical protein [Zoogloea sp.]|uniref:hypothetical protein n=1 Tax=Zoogloea sp. TaxID=49181 RepID=UPI0025DEC227|nr:hypothetical protein [Zoogloea sp.]
MPASLRRRLHTLLTLLAMACLQPALAGTLACSGTVNEIVHTATGELRIKPSWRGEWITLCNTATAWKGIPTDICKLWQAQALGAQITQVYTLLQYPSTAASTCAVMGTLGTADAASALTTY